MKEYMKPVLLTSDELAEGVYLASGDGSGCYTTTAYIHQTPQTGRGDYRIQVNAVHNADHTKEAQQLNISLISRLRYVSGWQGGAHQETEQVLFVFLWDIIRIRTIISVLVIWL